MKNEKYQTGFTLIEIAVAMVVLTFLTAGALITLRIQTQRSQTTETRIAIDETREALLGFAAAHGRIPCPDTNADGVEDLCNSSSRRGMIPSLTLGIVGQDAWSQKLRYVVAPPYTVSATLRANTAGDVEITDGANVAATTSAVALAVWSTGEDQTDGSSGENNGSNRVLRGSATRPSDDVIIWLSRYIVIGRMLEAGRNVPLN